MHLLAEISWVALMISVAGLLAAVDCAVGFARKTKLTHLSKRGSEAAHLALVIVGAPEKYRVAIRQLVALIFTFAAVFAGGLIAQHASRYVSPLVGFCAVAISMSFLLILMTEFVAKQIAIRAPERLLCFTAGGLVLIERLCSPLSRLF